MTSTQVFIYFAKLIVRVHYFFSTFILFRSRRFINILKKKKIIVTVINSFFQKVHPIIS